MRSHGHEPDASFDHVGVMVFTCTKRNLDINIRVFMINSSVLLFDDNISIVRAPLMFNFYGSNRSNFSNDRKMGPVWLFVGEVGIKTNVTLPRV